MTRITRTHDNNRTYTLSDELTCFACKQQHTKSIVEGSVQVRQSNKTKAYYRIQAVCNSDVCNGDRYDYVWYGNIDETEIIVTEDLTVPF